MKKINEIHYYSDITNDNINISCIFSKSTDNKEQ